MERTLLPDQPANGGYPEPPASEPVRIVAARHARCGSQTRVRLPGALAAGAVRRLRCAGCDAAYEAEEVEDLGIADARSAAAAAGETVEFDALADPAIAIAEAPASAKPARARGLWPSFDPRGRLWRWASVPLAMAVVVGAMLLIQRGNDEPTGSGTAGEAAPSPAATGGETPAADAVAGGQEGAQLVRGSRYALALPRGWRRSEPPGGAAFAAVARDGGADATLWIERAPRLGFPAFESRSLDQLQELAGSAEVVDRVAAPTREATIVRLAADAPPGEPRFEVTLRAAGPYRYYLATTVQPDASRQAIDGAELVHGTFTPDGGND